MYTQYQKPSFLPCLKCHSSCHQATFNFLSLIKRKVELKSIECCRSLWWHWPNYYPTFISCSLVLENYKHRSQRIRNKEDKSQVLRNLGKHWELLSRSTGSDTKIRWFFSHERWMQKQQRNEFLHPIVTGDEKWILYDSPKEHKHYVMPSPLVPWISTTKSNLFLL